MKLFWSVSICCALAQPTMANDCAELGLTSAFLTAEFCSELEKLTDDTRAMPSISGASDLTELPDEPWAEIGILLDAYRADPRKTLELIERIKGAGGLQPLDAN